MAIDGESGGGGLRGSSAGMSMRAAATRRTDGASAVAADVAPFADKATTAAERDQVTNVLDITIRVTALDGPVFSDAICWKLLHNEPAP